MISKTSANSNTTLAHRLWSWWVLRFKLAEVGPQWITIFSPLCPYAKYPKSPCPARPWSSFILDGLSPFLLKMWPWKIHLIHFPALTPPITGFLSHLWLAAVRIRWCPSWPQWLTQMCRACLKMWEIPVGYLWMCNFFHEDTYECAILHFFHDPGILEILFLNGTQAYANIWSALKPAQGIASWGAFRASAWDHRTNWHLPRTLWLFNIAMV